VAAKPASAWFHRTAKGIVASTAPAKLSTCFDCIQHRREIAQLKEYSGLNVPGTGE